MLARILSGGLSLVLLLPSTACAAERPLNIDLAESKVEVVVKATVDSFTGRSNRFEPTVLVGDDGRIVSARLRFSFQDVTTGKAKRDHAMHEWQHTPEFPGGEFVLNALEPDPAGKFIALGQLSLHGVTRELRFPVTVQQAGTLCAIDRGIADGRSRGRELRVLSVGGTPAACYRDGAMNTIRRILGCWLAMAAAAPGGLIAAESSTAAAVQERVGVYDSRSIAFAHFWGAEHQAKLRERAAAAKAAKDRGDTARYRELANAMAAEQKRIHLEVFSTAPASEALAALGPKLAALEAELGVSALISKWDEAALRGVPEARRVDVTDRLIQEFNPDERRRKTLAEMKKKPPLPLAEAQRLEAAGKL